jgi:NADH-ubiquinone oxidoreductase chain 4
MIKIFFVVLLGAAGVLFKRVSYWIVGGLIIFISLLFTTCELIITDYYFLGLGTGLDTISFRLVVLSFLVCALMLFSRNSIFTGPKISLLYFYFFVYSLMLVLVLTFLVSNLLTFYFFFEASLVPTLLIIMGWGYQPERLQAGIYFLFYTLGASLPLLLCIVIAWYTCGTLDLTGYLEFSNLGGMEFVIFFFIVLAFIVKMPIFFSHLWLPKAHVEAPVSGSIILAGVLLKLGGYGLYRVFTLAKSGVSGYRGYYFGLRTLGILFVGLICCRLRDIKALVAYSSVAHMGIVICGLVSYYY